jgi:hypothetical protein
VAPDFADPALGDARLQKFQVADDAGEYVVEIVRQSACELPNRLHILGLTSTSSKMRSSNLPSMPETLCLRGGRLTIESLRAVPRPSSLMMKAVGLIPSDTGDGRPRGPQEGQPLRREDGGKFAKACAELLSHGFDPFYVELWNEGHAAKRKKKAASKTKYTCPACGVNAWASRRPH